MKTLLFLWLCVLASGPLFAQTAETLETIDIIETEPALPKNTVTVDVAPIFYHLSLAGVFNLFYFNTTAKAFGIAAQYERHITEKASAAARLEYDVIGIGNDKFIWNIHAVLAEGHGRYYPGTGVFFLDGMLGYTAVFMDLSTFDTTHSAVAHYFKFGGKVGWSIDFGKPGGFTLEPGIGYYGAAGPAITIFDYYEDYETTNRFTTIGKLTRELYDDLKEYFLSGPRFYLGLGYRF